MAPKSDLTSEGARSIQMARSIQIALLIERAPCDSPSHRKQTKGTPKASNKEKLPKDGPKAPQAKSYMILNHAFPLGLRYDITLCVSLGLPGIGNTYDVKLSVSSGANNML